MDTLRNSLITYLLLALLAITGLTYLAPRIAQVLSSVVSAPMQKVKVQRVSL